MQRPERPPLESLDYTNGKAKAFMAAEAESPTDETDKTDDESDA
jgi:hypothetical protein